MVGIILQTGLEQLCSLLIASAACKPVRDRQIPRDGVCLREQRPAGEDDRPLTARDAAVSRGMRTANADVCVAVCSAADSVSVVGSEAVGRGAREAGEGEWEQQAGEALPVEAEPDLPADVGASDTEDNPRTLQ